MKAGGSIVGKNRLNLKSNLSYINHNYFKSLNLLLYVSEVLRIIRNLNINLINHKIGEGSSKCI
jgi:hypothetical protein